MLMPGLGCCVAMHVVGCVSVVVMRLLLVQTGAPYSQHRWRSVDTDSICLLFRGISASKGDNDGICEFAI